MFTCPSISALALYGKQFGVETPSWPTKVDRSLIEQETAHVYGTLVWRSSMSRGDKIAGAIEYRLRS